MKTNREIKFILKSIQEFFFTRGFLALANTIAELIRSIEMLYKENQQLKNSLDQCRRDVIWLDSSNPSAIYQGLAHTPENFVPLQMGEIEDLMRVREVYKRERDRYLHTNPEISGSYYLTGGIGEIDSNYMPQFVTVCPAYGCAWDIVYEKTDRTITYEGS